MRGKQLVGELVSDRFEVRGLIGTGAAGSVYRAYDRTRRVEVALKMLRDFGPTELARLKAEFRSLADLVHPNLVTLYELQSADVGWFFTMELIEGVRFLEYVRPYQHLVESLHARAAKLVTEGGRQQQAHSLAAAMQDTMQHADIVQPQYASSGSSSRSSRSSGRVAPAREAILQATLNEGRLRSSLLGLAQGVRRLHEAKKVHRDLKPSNVLVQNNGRVVICDFGLVTGGGANEGRIVGTPQYMAPEQAEGYGTVGPAADWYAVGVMLFEALVGHPPFTGVAEVILDLKRRVAPLEPVEYVETIPRDLNELCVALLSRDPAARPSPKHVMTVLGGIPAPETAAQARASETVFVGRRAHLEFLARALDTAKRGKPVTVLVSGLSGTGKSTLVHHFFSKAPGDVVVLEGRCYERESVPYKALDALVDAITEHLLGLGAEAAELVNPEVALLVNLFPGLRRVKAIDRLRIPQVADARESRARAFRALRELLRDLADRHPTIVYIDDLQWGDIDSAPLLRELIHSPDAPPVLFVASYRSDEADTSPLLGNILRRGESAGADVRELSVQPLPEDEATSLALTLMADTSLETTARVRDIVREAWRSPTVHHRARPHRRHRRQRWTR